MWKWSGLKKKSKGKHYKIGVGGNRGASKVEEKFVDVGGDDAHDLGGPGLRRPCLVE